MPKYGIVFDLDGTLLSTSKVYYDIQIELMRYIQDCASPFFISPREVLDVYDLVRSGSESDSKRASDYCDSLELDTLDSPERFPRDLTEIFVESMIRAGVFPTREQAQRAYDIGTRVFTSEYLMMPGARKLVEYLARRQHDTVLFMVTKGSRMLQEPKLKRKVFRKFQKIYVIDPEVSKGIYLKRLQKEYPDVDTWVMIGDSIAHDINPALADGLVAIHVKRGSYEDKNVRVLDIAGTLNRYVPVYDLYEAETVLREAIYGTIQVKAGG